MKSKDPYLRKQVSRIFLEVRSTKHEVASIRVNIGVLRLRGCFAKRSSPCAQDDISKMKCVSRFAW